MTVASLAMTGSITADVVQLYVIGLPGMLAGLWAGFRLYGKLDDAAFRKLVLVMLLLAGLALAATYGWPLVYIRDGSAVALTSVSRPEH